MIRKRDRNKERSIIFQPAGPVSSKGWKGREMEKKGKLWKEVRRIR